MTLTPPAQNFYEQTYGLTPLRKREEAWRANPGRDPAILLCMPCYDGLRAEGVAERMSTAIGRCFRCSNQAHLFSLWPFELRLKDEGREEIAASVKVHENMLRRMAKRRGFILMKSRVRDPYSPIYGRWLVSREDPPVHSYVKTLDEVEELLRS